MSPFLNFGCALTMALFGPEKKLLLRMSYSSGSNGNAGSSLFPFILVLIGTSVLTIAVFYFMETALIPKREPLILPVGRQIATSPIASTPKATPIARIAVPEAISDIRLVEFSDRGQSTTTAPLASVPRLSQLSDVDFHFVHIPKCGGTSMTAILREVACSLDPERNIDCCTNPGFCDYHALRRCASIKGCINHFPQRYHH